ncbi:MAG: TasA family protein [Chloroflexota bacterium]|nr:TasA family protein [Chloroflexota bacterium]
MMKSNKRTPYLIFLLLLVAALAVGGLTMAYFTSSARNDGNSFASGTLQVELDKENGDHYFDLEDIKPGDSGAMPIEIANSGSLSLQYKVVLTLSGDLSAGDHPLQLSLRVNEEDAVDPAYKRLLRGGEHETLYLGWEMPKDAGNDYQNATGTLSIRVNAEQIASQNGSQLVYNANRISADLGQNGIMAGASTNYSASGGSSDAWSVRLEQFLEGGAPGTNIYGFVNPVPSPDPRYQGQAIINYGTMGLSEEFWNPAVFITDNSAYGYDFSPQNSHYDRLCGSLIFYKTDNASDTVYFYSIDDSGVKSALNAFTID